MRIFSRTFFFFAFLLMGSPLQLTANEAQTYTRADLVARALQHNPLIHAAEAELDVFEAKLQYAERWWMPRLKFQSLITAIPKQWGNAVEGDTDFGEWGPYSRTEASFVMPLLTFGKVANLKEMAAAGVDISLAKKDLAERTGQGLVDQA